LNRLERKYNDWIDTLEEWRKKSQLLKLFSNRQIMNMIILLTNPTPHYRIKHQLFKKLYLLDTANDNNDENMFQITIYSLAYYLRSLPINENDPFEHTISDLCKKTTLQHDLSVDASLMHLDRFLTEFLKCIKQTVQTNVMNNESQQYLVTLNSIHHTSDKKSFECTLDIDTFCILLNLFPDRLPSAYQILWCSTINEDDIHLFFSRIRTFSNLVFVIMDIDKMNPRLREVLLNEQDLLKNSREPHGIVYYFSRELTTYRRGLKFFHVTSVHRNVRQTHVKLTQLFRQTERVPPEIHIICGKEGTGKLPDLIFILFYLFLLQEKLIESIKNTWKRIRCVLVSMIN
jgi:hypothetical protein